ncbi:hypothetical protein [Nannocystis pusilla]|uniref:hypothetical protein n=1 Tax=Nannocystis pusilla TaxID=889268 RepID=UPI003BF0FA8B
MTPAELARLFDLPAEAGARAQAARAAHFGRRVLVRGVVAHPSPSVAALVRGAGPALVDLASWSEEHVARAMADGAWFSGHVAADMSDSAGPNGQGVSAMPDAAGPKGHGAQDMAEGSGPIAGVARGSADGSAGAATSGEARSSADAPASGELQSAHVTSGAGSADASASGEHGSATDERESGDPGWPEPEALRAGDRLVLQVDRSRLAAYFEYLSRLATAAPEGLSVAPFCALAGGLMRLHLIAAARVALPGRVRVEARHDLLGIRLAQVALGFGADTLAGPLAQTRKLPLAGVPRPDEATPAGLAALIERAGLEPVLDDMTSETLP